MNEEHVGSLFDKSMKRILGAALPLICISLSLLSSLFACLAVMASDADSKYFTDSPEMTIFTVLLAFALILPFLFSFALKGAHSRILPIPARLASILPAAACLYCTFMLVSTGSAWLDAIAWLSFFTAFFFILKLSDKYSALKVLFSLVAFALSTAIIAYLYLDFDIELNSPYKLALQFGAVGIIFGVIADTRMILGRIPLGFFVFLKSSAALACSVASGIVITAFSLRFSVLPDSYLVLAMLFVSFALSAYAELVSVSVCRIKTRT